MSQYACPHCGTIPCECDMSDGARLSRCLDSNRQLREELEKVKKANDTLANRSVAAMGIADGDIAPTDYPKVENECPMLSSVVRMSRALAAAKEALETAGAFTAYDSEAKDHYSFHKSLAYQKALARIAECEKD